MNIKEFSIATGLTPRAIRFYEEKGILRGKRDPNNKYRVFQNSDITIGKKIAEFRKLGFSIEEVAHMLKASPSLEVKEIKNTVRANLAKLYKDQTTLEKRIRNTEALLEISTDSPLTSKQRDLMKNMALIHLDSWSLEYIETRLKKKHLGPDEELQVIACAYADLVFKHNIGSTFKKYAEAHRLIAKTLIKAKETHLAERHKRLALAYENLHKDPHYYDLKEK